MKNLLFLPSFIVLLTGCMVTPDDSYYRLNTGYYGPAYYDGYYSRNQHPYRIRSSYSNPHFSKKPIPPKNDHGSNRPARPPINGNGQNRPMPPQNNHNGQYKPSRPNGNGQQRPSQVKPGNGQNNSPLNWDRGNGGQNRPSVRPNMNQPRPSGR